MLFLSWPNYLLGDADDETMDLLQEIATDYLLDTRNSKSH